MKKIISLLALTLSLQSCFFAVGAAAGAAGVAAVYDHRQLQNIMEDQHIADQIARRISASKALVTNTHINVTSFNQVVLLTGEASQLEYKQQAEEIARGTPNVKKVYNQITIENPSSSLTRTNDTWITTKIKTQMLATEGLKSGTIKVVTENGSVYLLGIVTKEQADMAVDIARQASGVKRVVKMFQYK